MECRFAEVRDDGGENERKYQFILENTRDIILIHGYTDDGLPDHFVDVNSFACHRLGYSRYELLQMSVGDIVKRDEVADIRGTSRYLEDKKSKIFEKTLVTRSGEPLDVEVNACLFYVRNTKYTLSICRDITDRKRRELEKEELIDQLRQALADVKKLSGLLPICSGCKKIRDDKGYWLQLETYIQENSEAKFSHGLCQECMERMYPECIDGEEG